MAQSVYVLTACTSKPLFRQPLKIGLYATKRRQMKKGPQKILRARRDAKFFVWREIETDESASIVPLKLVTVL